MIDDELLYLWYGMMNRMVHTQKIELAFRFGGIRGLWETSEKVLQESLTKKQFETVRRTGRSMLYLNTGIGWRLGISRMYIQGMTVILENCMIFRIHLCCCLLQEI